MELVRHLFFILPSGNADARYYFTSASIGVLAVENGKISCQSADNYVPDRVRAEFDQMPIVRFLSKVPVAPIVPAPDREFADFLV